MLRKQGRENIKKSISFCHHSISRNKKRSVLNHSSLSLVGILQAQLSEFLHYRSWMLVKFLVDMQMKYALTFTSLVFIFYLPAFHRKKHLKMEAKSNKVVIILNYKHKYFFKLVSSSRNTSSTATRNVTSAEQVKCWPLSLHAAQQGLQTRRWAPWLLKSCSHHRER